MNDLRKKVIKLAHDNPPLRKDLLPLLKQAARGGLIETVLPMGDIHKLRKSVDEQSGKLAVAIYRHFANKFAFSTAEQEAFNRLVNSVKNANSWDQDLLRNNLFKAAHSLGIKLPSGIF